MRRLCEQDLDDDEEETLEKIQQKAIDAIINPLDLTAAIIDGKVIHMRRLKGDAIPDDLI